MNLKASESGFFSKQNLLSLFLPAFTLALGQGISAPVLPVFAKSFEVTFGVASLVIIVPLVGSILATLPTGLMIDKFGRRRILLAGPLLTSLSSVLTAVAQTFPELLVYRFIGGWASQMWSLSRLALIADTGGDSQRGRQITGMFGLDNAGRLLGPVLGGFAAAAWGIRVPFVLHGLAVFLAILPSFTMVKETAHRRSETRSTGNQRSAQPSLLKLLTFELLLLLGVQLLATLSRGALHGGGTMNLYMAYAYNSGPAVLGVLNAATGALGIPITFTAGYLMDRFGRKTTIVPGFLLTGIGLSLVALTSALQLSFTTFVVAYLFVQASQSLTSGSMQTLASDVAPAEARGRFFGMWKLVGELGHMGSPLGFALLAEWFGFTSGFLFLSVTGISAALIFAFFTRESLKR